MPSETRTRVEGLKAERLRFRRIDDFPHIYTQLVVQDLELVDERDVHRSIGVLEDLARLRDFKCGSPNDSDDGVAVHLTGKVTALFIEPAHDFRDCRRLE